MFKVVFLTVIKKGFPRDQYSTASLQNTCLEYKIEYIYP